MGFVDVIIKIISALTLLSHVMLGLFVIILMLAFLKNQDARGILKFLQKNAKAYIFIISLTAVCGSLFMSEIAAFAPCKLCWFQRIFMYPLPIISLLSLLFRDKVRKYVMALSGIGAIIASIHVIENVTAIATFCSATAVSCNAFYFQEFGYITIPIMSLTAFVMIFILSILGKAI